MAAMPHMKRGTALNLIDPKVSVADEYNRLQLKHMKARTQIMESAAVLMMFLLLVTCALLVFAAGLMVFWLIGWLF